MNRTMLAIALICLLFALNLALLARPCELYRARVVWAEPAFTVRNTVAAWDVEREVCICVTVGSDDPWIIAEGLSARLLSQDRIIMPRVEF